MDSDFSLKLGALCGCHASSCHAGRSRRLVGLSVFDLLLPAIPLPLLDVLVLPLLLLFLVPLPAALLPGFLHRLKLARHVSLFFALLWNVASGHWLSGPEKFLKEVKQQVKQFL